MSVTLQMISDSPPLRSQHTSAILNFNLTIIIKMVILMGLRNQSNPLSWVVWKHCLAEVISA